MDINFSDVEKLIKIVENAQISELEVMDGATTIRITSRHGSLSKQCNRSKKSGHYTQNPSLAPVVQSTNDQPSFAETTLKPTDTISQAISETNPVTSPMVGTFFRSTEPNAKPLIEVGQTVTTNQTLCIIEAMKIMHEVKAEKAGTVSEILVTDGDMVEYGQPLFVLV